MMGKRARRGKAATEVIESSYAPNSDDHAGRRAAMALTRRESCETNRKFTAEFARSLRAT